MAKRIPLEKRQEAARVYKETGLAASKVAEIVGLSPAVVQAAAKELIPPEEFAALPQQRWARQGHTLSPEALERMRARWGENNPNFQGDAAQPKSARYRAVRKYDISDKTCETCGKAAQIRHHHNENTYDNKPENLAYLCRSCHAKEHHQRGCFKASAGMGAAARWAKAKQAVG